MPYVWIEPGKFMSDEETGDTVVYHCHAKGCLTVYHYQICPDSDWMAFDIRELAAEMNLRAGTTRAEHKSIIKCALDSFDAPLETALRRLEIWWEGETG